MQVGNGKISVGTVTVTVTGTNDVPEVSEPVVRGGAEGAGAFTVNLLDHASDVDHGAVLHVADVVWTAPHTSSGLPPGFSMGANGTLIVDANDPAYNSLAVDEAKTWTLVTTSLTSTARPCARQRQSPSPAPMIGRR